MPRTRDRSRPNPTAPIAIAVSVAMLCAAPFQAGAAGEQGHHDHAHGAHAAARQPLEAAQAELRRARERLPPAPAGVTDLALGELFGTIGDRGLAYSEKTRALDGRTVRMLGFMVNQDEPVEGTILLAPFPFQLHETEYGLAEDLPASLVHVQVADRRNEIVPYTPGLLLLTGELSIGPREEPDGRISTVRLQLHPRGDALPHPAAHEEENER